MYVSAHSEVGRVDDLVRRGVGKDSLNFRVINIYLQDIGPALTIPYLGMDTGLVRERAHTRHGVVKRYVDVDSLRDEVLDL